MSDDGARPPGPAAGVALDDIRLAVIPGPLAAPLVARVVGIAASRADLPVDRLDDALLVADAIAAHAPAQLDPSADRLVLLVRTRPGLVELLVGPLRHGGGRRLLEDSAIPAAGNVITRLATRANIVGSDAGDELMIHLDGVRGDATT